MTTDTDRFLTCLRQVASGRDRATSAACLHVATGITPRRQQAIIIELQERGEIVCSACDRKPFGYYVPTVDEEIAPYLHQLRQRRNALATRIAGIEAQRPTLRETRKVTPPLRIEPSGKPEQLQLVS